MTKNCIRCNQEKPLEAFYVHPQMADGHLNKCIACCRTYSQERYEAQPGLDKRSARPVAAKKRSTRNAARVITVRQPCEVEGCTRVAEKHHDDYDQPLKVRWLCRRHHGEVHRRLAA
jgi:hypothetical protein